MNPALKKTLKAFATVALISLLVLIYLGLQGDRSPL